MKLSRKVFLSLIFGLFFLSGFAGLIYESIWTHYLKLFVGHAAYSQTLVLVIYMGGMALGSWLTSVYIHRIKSLLTGYAIAELLLGLTAVIFHPAFVKYLSISYNSVMPALASPFLTSLYKWITASLMILPQTILLGATFPLMTGGIIRHYKDTPGHTISFLYFVNSLGGAFGVIMSGYFLINKFALPGTVVLAGIVDIIVALGVLALISEKDFMAAKQHSLNVLGNGPIYDSEISRLALSVFLTSCIKTGDYTRLEQTLDNMKWRRTPDTMHRILSGIAAEGCGGKLSVTEREIR